MSLEETQNLVQWFNPDRLAPLDYYFLEIEGYIKFDNFTLTMIKRRRYLLIPSTEAALERTKSVNESKFTRFIEGLKIRGLSKSVHHPLRRIDFDDIGNEVRHMRVNYRRIYDSGEKSSWWPF